MESATIIAEVARYSHHDGARDAGCEGRGGDLSSRYLTAVFSSLTHTATEREILSLKKRQYKMYMMSHLHDY